MAYVAHYGDRAQAVVQRRGFRRILPPAISTELFSLLLEGGGDFVRRAGALALRAAPSLLGGQEGRNRLYLNVGHTGLELEDLPAWLARLDVRPVFMVHDLIPITHPEYCRAGEKERHVRRMMNVLQAGTAILGNSDDTLVALARFAGSRQLSMPPALAVALGADDPVTGALAAGGDCDPPLAKPYFLMLGTIEGRKNHALMLALWRSMIADMGDSAPALVIIGQRGWECEQAVDMLDRCEMLRGHVVELGGAGDDVVRHYMRHARALLFPSFVEGFGMPLVEALAAGLPVIASDIGVFRDVGLGIPHYADPLDGLAWRNIILDYALWDSSLRAAQLRRLLDYVPPSWGGHFVVVDRWLAEL
ncbi:glycosyltransferase family 1 protein [Sphingomonas fennica]|uniref:Glycosyltransferase family 1 protein n=2 Tax=Edaphosphingomonas fennica TaxID=114404 RepID=A0A2T4HLT2_9SPHN|nr:glycosyltransferase family 1 protein [Sphingomonas fennica]